MKNKDVHVVSPTKDRIDSHYDTNRRNASRQNPEDTPFKSDDKGLEAATRWHIVEGFVCIRENPYGHWRIYRAPNEGVIPERLKDKYTTLTDIEKAIKLFLQRGKDETKTG